MNVSNTKASESDSKFETFHSFLWSTRNIIVDFYFANGVNKNAENNLFTNFHVYPTMTTCASDNPGIVKKGQSSETQKKKIY